MYDFVRGWDVFEERAFDFVCFDFYGFAPSVKRTLSTLNVSNTNDRLTRELLYAPIQDALDRKMEQVLRADEYMNDTRNAFVNGEPLLTYLMTKHRHYDMSYISLDILHSGIEYERSNFRSYGYGSRKMKDGIRLLKTVGKQYVETGTFNETLYQDGNDKFTSGCRTYNYRMFKYEERVVEKPVEVCDKIIDDFERTHRTFDTAFSTSIRKINECRELLLKIQTQYINEIHNISFLASEYQRNRAKLKTPLCIEAAKMDGTIRLLTVAFDDLRSVVRDLDQSMYVLKSATADVWKGVLDEVATHKLYEHLYNDSITFLEDDTQYEFFMDLFASMLRIKDNDALVEFRNSTRIEIVKLINGDLHEMHMDDVMFELNRLFDEISNLVDISQTIGNKDESLLASFQNLRLSLRKFQMDNEIDAEFYK